MTIKRWIRGTTAEETKAPLFAEFPPGEGPNEIQIQDTGEIFQYDDANLSPQQQAALNSELNSTGWTDVSP